MGSGDGLVQKEIIAALRAAKFENPRALGVWFTFSALGIPILRLSTARQSSLRRACGGLQTRREIDRAYVFADLGSESSSADKGSRWSIVLRVPPSKSDEGDIYQTVEQVNIARVALIDHGHKSVHSASACRKCESDAAYVRFYESWASLPGTFLPDDPRINGERRQLNAGAYYANMRQPASAAGWLIDISGRNSSTWQGDRL